MNQHDSMFGVQRSMFDVSMPERWKHGNSEHRTSNIEHSMD